MSQFVDFSGLWVPLVTPFENGNVDTRSLQRLVAHLARSPLKGFIACGSTGEAESLSHAEQRVVLDTVLSARGDKPVMMGLGGARLDDMLAHLHEVVQRPVAGLLVSAPPYLRPAQAGIVAHFRALADASPVPLMLYDVPARTGVSMTLDTLLALAGHPNIRAIKDCGGDDEKTRALIADGRLAVLAGDDARIFATACLGGVGAVAASGNVVPAHLARLLVCGAQGHLAEARRLHHALAPLATALFAEPNPSVFKAVLARQGWIGDALRAPHSAASSDGVQRAWAALAAADALMAGEARYS